MTEISRRGFLKLASGGLAAAAASQLKPTPVAEASTDKAIDLEQIRAQVEAAVKYAYDHIPVTDVFNRSDTISTIFVTQAQKGDLAGAVETAQEFHRLTPAANYPYYGSLTHLAKIAAERKTPGPLKKLLEAEEAKGDSYTDYDYKYRQLDYYLYLADAQAAAGSPGLELDQTLARIFKIREEGNLAGHDPAEVDNRVNSAVIRSSFRNGERTTEDAMGYSRSIAGNFEWAGGDWGYWGQAQGYSTIAKELIQAKREDLIDPLIKKVSQLNPGSDLASQKDIAVYGIAKGLCELGLTYWPKHLADTLEAYFLKADLHSQIAQAIAKIS